MEKTDKEVLELCKAWFEDIMERCDRLTSGNVSHGGMAIRGVAKNYAEFVDEHLERMWKPSDEQMKVLNEVLNFAANHESSYWNDYIFGTLNNLIRQLRKLREE